MQGTMCDYAATVAETDPSPSQQQGLQGPWLHQQMMLTCLLRLYSMAYKCQLTLVGCMFCCVLCPWSAPVRLDRYAVSQWLADECPRAVRL